MRRSVACIVESSDFGMLLKPVQNDAGAPAATVGWRHPGYIHTAFLKELGPGEK